MTSLSAVVKRMYDTLIRYALKFGVVGLVGFAIDIGIFNLLRTGSFGATGWITDPLGAKTISVSVAIVATWIGNRYWTFRERRRGNYVVEFLEFLAVAIAGMGISLLCLYISHYVLGFTSLLADNISANVIGLVIATAFRFLMYRFWVYGHHRSDGLQHRTAAASAAAESPTVSTEAS